MKASTIEMLHEYEQVLQAFAKTIANKHRLDIDDDDWWTAFALNEDCFADINVYVSDDNKRTILKVAAYPVDESGFTITDEWLSLYECTATKKSPSKFSIRKFRK
jgi:hypothetical protein